MHVKCRRVECYVLWLKLKDQQRWQFSILSTDSLLMAENVSVCVRNSNDVCFSWLFCWQSFVFLFHRIHKIRNQFWLQWCIWYGSIISRRLYVFNRTFSMVWFMPLFAFRYPLRVFVSFWHTGKQVNLTMTHIIFNFDERLSSVGDALSRREYQSQSFAFSSVNRA